MSYTFKDKEYTEEEIEAIAIEKGYTVGELLAKNAELNKLVVPDLMGKSKPTDQDESVDATETSKSTELPLENGSLGLTAYKDLTDKQKKQLSKQEKNKLKLDNTSGARRDRRKLQKTIELDEVVVTAEDKSVENFRVNTSLKESQENYALEWGNRNFKEFQTQASKTLGPTEDELAIKQKAIDLAQNESRSLQLDENIVEYLKYIDEEEQEEIKDKKLDEIFKLDKEIKIGVKKIDVTYDGYYGTKDMEGSEVYKNPNLVNLISIERKMNKEPNSNNEEYSPFDVTGLGYYETLEIAEKIKKLGDPKNITTQEGVDEYNELIADYDQALANNKTVELKNGVVMPTATYDLYVELSKERNAVNTTLKKYYDEIVELPGDAKSLEKELKLLKKNYSTIDKAVGNLKLTLGSLPYNFVGGTLRLMADTIEMVSDIPIYDVETGETNPLVPYPDYVPFSPLANYKKIANNLQFYTEEARKKYQEEFKDDVDFDEAFDSVNNLVEFSIQEIVSQSGNLAMLSLGLGPGALGIGITSYEDQRRFLEKEDKELGTERSALYKSAVALGYAIPEVALGFMPTYFIYKRVLDRAARTTGILPEMNKFVLKQLAKGAGVDTLTEIPTEAATVFVQNGLDVIIGRKENTTANLFENVDHAAFSALLVSGTLNTVPIVKGMAVSALSDYNSYESVMADYKKLVQIEAIYKKQDKRRTPAKANKSLIIRLKNNIDEKIQEQNLKIKSQLTSEGFSLFAEAKKQQQILRQQAKSIIEDNSTSDKDKNVSLQKIKNIFDALENATNDFKKDYKVNIDLLSRKERNVLLDKANIELSKENKKTDPAAVKI